jgi:hypothetical protein
MTHPQHTLSRGMLRPKENRPEKGGWKTRPVLGADRIARARGHLEGDLLHHMLQINCALISRQQGSARQATM